MFNQTPTEHDGVYQECVDHDALYESLTFQPVIANFLDITTLKGKEELNQLLYSRYEGDSLNVIPTCDCGILAGGRYLDKLCTNCNTTCTYVTEKALESLLWIQAPRGIARLITPTAWLILSDAWSFPAFNLLEWLTNPLYQTNPKTMGKLMPKLQRFIDHGIPRGINHFYENFDTIVELIYRLKIVKDFGPKGNDIQTWISENRNYIFPQFLPVPSKVGFVVEDSGNSTYIDDTITLAFDAIRTIIAIETATIPLSSNRTQANAVTAIKTLAQYYFTFAGDTLGGKPGVFRKHVFGGSLMFTGRAVISSLSKHHSYDELHLPWSLAIQLLKLHIASKLLKPPYRMTSTVINNLCRDYALKYHPILDEVMTTLIREAPKGKLPCLFQRNPSLNRGSCMLLFITKIKTDPKDNTIGFSVLTLKACNADYDGDEMNLMLILDNYTYRRLSRLEPHLFALDLDAPRRISRYLTMPGPVVSTIAEWLHKGR